MVSFTVMIWQMKRSLVFGGHSPIALAISRKLSEVGPVIHVSRNVDQSLRDSFLGIDNVTFITWDSFQFDKDILQSSFLRDEKIGNLVFAHRYRENHEFVNDIEHFKVEVYFPYNLIMNMVQNSLFAENSSILFVTSPAAKYVVSDQPVMYHLSKASINQLVRFLSLKLAPQLKINAISPGSYVLKDRNLDFFSYSSPRGKIIRDFLPLAEIPSTMEIANLVQFLLSENNSLLNGQIIDLSGGYLNMEVSQVLNRLLDN